jgi:hypothetical protein
VRAQHAARSVRARRHGRSRYLHAAARGLD